MPIPDLIRLERYERRAWHKRAIREFGLIKFHQDYVAGRSRPLQADPRERDGGAHGPAASTGDWR
jgi:hypothetical protein